ncbi:WG repeat-containing protein [Larkinella terrae]|uniref:WG repeat-containing protein n=1 Tax=Larkinella terrae TaxID=2025311 RepID=A0A7K0ERT1_9BACT|nr:WG repeat-containing protein [Larkinella terrae]MRS64469.1 hypothetical protein [Larkinella terrae]
MIDTIHQKIQEVFGHYDRYVPADVINRLFVAIPYDETALTQEIMGYLLEHNYEALETPKGQSLRERLISTDWRQKEEKKWLLEPEPVELPATAEVSVTPVSIPFSQSNKILIALVILFMTVLLWLWKDKLTQINNDVSRVETSEVEPISNGTSVQVRQTISQPSTAKLVRKAGVLPVSEGTGAKNNTNLIVPVSETGQPLVTEPSNPVESVNGVMTKPYDTVDAEIGDFGLRAARKGGKWGYVDQKDQWHIDPVYDDVTPFQNGKATVVLDGQQIVIDRDGARIREES